MIETAMQAGRRSGHGSLISWWSLGAWCATVVLLLSGCGTTRTETDYYTITDREQLARDTTVVAPGSAQDHGVLFPTARTTETRRETLSHDSTHERTYPDFMRAGGLEFAGLLSSSGTNGIGLGLFGLYHLFDLDQIVTNGHSSFYSPGTQQAASNSLFKAELIRVAPLEYRLRWLGDAHDWTLGWNLVELLDRDELSGDRFTSVGLNAYLRHRTWIRDQAPYVFAAPYVGLSLWPSAYLNAGGELTVGSLAGMNLRAYLGAAAGYASVTDRTHILAFPYAGLGVSVLDFVNREQETEREWKDYAHHGINVDILDVTLIKAGQSYLSIFDTTMSGLPFQGVMVRLATTEIPLPVLNGHVWAGTSLFNYQMLGFFEQGFGILPLRLGYRHYLFAEDLMIEPFVEYDYYPSSFYNVGVRAKLDTYTGYNLGLVAGYTAGTPMSFTPQAFNTGAVQSATRFSTAYLGLSFLIGDHNDRPEKALGRKEETR